MGSIAQEQQVRNSFRGNHSTSRKFKRTHLSRNDQRLLLTSTLTLFLRRIERGLPVLRTDLSRIAEFADDVVVSCPQ